MAAKNQKNNDQNKLLMKFFGHDWAKEYENDYYLFLREHETRRRDNYMLSPQREYRSDVILWMKDVCKACNLSILTLHLAAYILDSFMDQHEIKPFRLRFIAASSISLAAKFEENGGGVPSYGKMYSINNPTEQPVPPPHIICQIEWKIFRFMNCNLHVPTAAHFVYYFLVKGLQETDFQQSNLSEREVRMIFRDILQHFLDNMLEDLWSLKLPPSWMASASLMYARQYLGLVPKWPEEIAELTELTVEKIQPALTLVHKYYMRPEKIDTISLNDSGYLSLDSPAEFNLVAVKHSTPAQSMSQAIAMSQEMSPPFVYLGERLDTSNYANFLSWQQPAFQGVQLFSQETVDMELP